MINEVWVSEDHLRASCACYHRALSVKSCALEEDSPLTYRLTIASVLQRDANRWTQHRAGRSLIPKILSFRKLCNAQPCLTTLAESGPDNK
jgi:hypothetical protein